MSEISTNLAKKLVQNFVINKMGQKIEADETRGVWFSRDDIEKALNTPVHEILPNGLRFYFAAYETNNGGTRPPSVDTYQNKVTLVIIPTTQRLDEDGHIIMSRDKPTEILPFDLLTDPDAKPEYDKAFNKQANDGQLCPPPRPII